MRLGNASALFELLHILKTLLPPQLSLFSIQGLNL